MEKKRFNHITLGTEQRTNQYWMYILIIVIRTMLEGHTRFMVERNVYQTLSTISKDILFHILKSCCLKNGDNLR